MFTVDTSQIVPLLVGVAIVIFVFGSIGCLIYLIKIWNK